LILIYILINVTIMTFLCSIWAYYVDLSSSIIVCSYYVQETSRTCQNFIY